MKRDDRISVGDRCLKKLITTGWDTTFRVTAQFTDNPNKMRTKEERKNRMVNPSNLDVRRLTLKQILSVKYYNAYYEELLKKDRRFRDDGKVGRIYASNLPLLGGVRRWREILELRKEIIAIINDIMAQGYSTDFGAMKVITDFKVEKRLVFLKKRYMMQVKYQKYIGKVLKRRLVANIRECEKNLNMEPCELPTT